MAEAYTSLLRGVPIQTLVRIKPMKPGQREDLRISGNRLTLLDINSRIRDEAEVFDVFPSHTNNAQIFESQLQAFVAPAIQGLNVGIITLGSSGSGKSFTLGGSGTELGVAHYFVEAVFNALTEKANAETTGTYNCTLRMQFVEIANEEVTDLLGKGKGAIPLSAEQDEWEGSALQGAEHKIVNSAQQFADLYAIGVQNRTTLSNAFGRLSDKAAAVLSVEIIQITEVAGDTQVLVSKIMFVECPGLEVLAQDPESLKIKQGPTLNQGVLMLQDISYDLASGKADAINYGGSQLTKICSELLGGNAVSIAIFNYQYDDQIGSGATMKFMKVCQRIVNFPISNDNRAICLLHKLRKENVNLRKVLYGAGGETIEQYQLKIAELEKRLIGGNLETMKFVEEKKGMASKLQELKDKYNAVVKQKAEIQSQLLNAEEEKLSLSKGLIEQQIENAKLQEQIQNIRFEYEAKDIHAEADTLALESRQEKAQKTIMDLQESLAKITTEKREFELELMTVRRNYLNKCKEVEELKKKNQQVGVELINVINENKALMRGNGLASTKSGLSSNYDKFSRKITALENENDKLKEELAKTASELEKATSDKLKTEVILEQMKLDYDKKRVALEREYVSLAKNKDGQIQAIRKVDQEGTKWRQADKTLWESEKYDLHKKIKDLNRKLEMMSTELREVKELNDELKADKNSIGTQLDELRTAYRNKLAKATGDEARTELVNTYIAREKQMGEENIVLRTRIERLRTKCRSLREYAKQLKFLCEDVFPEDKMKPDILQVDEPPIIKEEQGDVGKAGKKGDMLMVELGKLKEENYNLKMTIEQLQSKIGRLKEGRGGAAGEGEIQKKILEELKMLKENPKAAGRPISGNDEYDRLRKERNNLLEENIKLKQIIEQDSVGPASGGNIKQLKQKILHLENAVRDLEKERSELKVRATMAEQQLKTLQEHYNRATQDYQKKIIELKKRIGA